uniref:SPRY domain-containing protein n=1 Tax=Meloidogyne hapla TaxID=6305 RepID=A0A1I8BIG1_MELHA
CFIHVANKWKEISFKYDSYKCCKNKCINTNTPIGYCIEGNGFINLIDGENIKYVNCVEGKANTYNRTALIFVENQFNKPKEYFNYSLFYFEIKCKIEEVNNNNNKCLYIGLHNNNDFIEFCADKATIFYSTENKELKLKFPTFSWNDEDVFGCGLIYPPTNKMSEECPYIFFSQNGKQIGRLKLGLTFESN